MCRLKHTLNTPKKSLLRPAECLVCEHHPKCVAKLTSSVRIWVTPYKAAGRRVSTQGFCTPTSVRNTCPLRVQPEAFCYLSPRDLALTCALVTCWFNLQT